MIDDYLARWTLDDFACLSLYSRKVDVPTAEWSQGFTLCFWFWAANLERRQVILRSDETPPLEIAIQEGKLVFRISDESEVRTPLADDLWHHAALIFDPRKRQFSAILDGQLQGESAITHPSNTRIEGLLVGGYTDPAGGHYDFTFGRGGSGLIDDLRIYPRVLSWIEIAQFVGQASQPPRAAFTIEPISAEAPCEVRLDASSSESSEGRINHYLWDFGDGERGSGQIVRHRYEYGGAYRIRLAVVDEHHGMASAEQQLRPGGQPNPLHFVPVFVNGKEGYACYRIPSIVRALNGDLVAFAEARLESCSDSTGTIHLVCKRSADNGETWSPLQVIAALEGFVAMNASPVVDEVFGTGRIVVVFRAASHSEWDIARGIGVNRAMCLTSDDHGKTWTPPRDITAFVHKPYNPAYAEVCPACALPENQTEDWRIQIPSQGHAIQLRRLAATRGRLFFAGSLMRGNRSIFESENYAFWSDDLGETWQMGEIIPRVGLNEATAAELEDGSMLFNTRAYTDGKPDGRRAVTIARFDSSGRIRYDETRHDETLIDPAVQATLLRCTWSDQVEYGGKSRLLFANPAHEHARVNLTVRLSYDEGRRWAHSRVIDKGPSAYSDLVTMRDMQIGLLYECGNTGGITFVHFSLDWLTGGEDRL